MHKLFLATGIVALALAITQAQAGSQKNLKSKPPQTSRTADHQVYMNVITNMKATKRPPRLKNRK